MFNYIPVPETLFNQVFHVKPGHYLSVDIDKKTVQDITDDILPVVEDNIWSYWQGAGTYHNAHNVARDWVSTEDLTISSGGESQTFSGTFNLSEDWNSDSVKIIAIVQNYSSKSARGLY